MFFTSFDCNEPAHVHVERKQQVQDVDEDLSVEGVLRGVPAHRPKSVAAPKRGVKGAPNKRIQPTRVKRRAQVGGRIVRG